MITQSESMNNEVKREATLEELEKELNELEDRQDALKELIKKKRHEESERKKAQLALEKDARQKEIEDTYKTLKQLVDSYVKNYGSFEIKQSYADNDNLWRLLFSSKPFYWHW